MQGGLCRAFSLGACGLDGHWRRRRILLTDWDSLLSFRLAWRTLSSKLNAFNLQGLKIKADAF